MTPDELDAARITVSAAAAVAQAGDDEPDALAGTIRDAFAGHSHAGIAHGAMHAANAALRMLSDGASGKQAYDGYMCALEAHREQLERLFGDAIYERARVRGSTAAQLVPPSGPLPDVVSFPDEHAQNAEASMLIVAMVLSHEADRRSVDVAAAAELLLEALAAAAA